MIKVVRGNPTPEELAAALAVVQARAAARDAAAPEASESRPEWSAPARRLAATRMASPGPRAWRTTYWPS
ncbi:acyl-CoA carboxylase epsilon subunit [Streptomyces sp. VNUA116]|uniref:acyl-CoA carboxylase epsilon subunit n=1 Tax=Streptomyces sp. VNUA116 TaxID=3062449 RepID=UPI00267466A1|nr:acyl-CoA carboxylase epsilon subunit [Streptomyces sp. VNUA116]WKU46629.1 acyl-CoA carboxylase epsilon subunit [Streptomyces sp. VNUA116]